MGVFLAQDNLCSTHSVEQQPQGARRASSGRSRPPAAACPRRRRRGRRRHGAAPAAACCPHAAGAAGPQLRQCPSARGAAQQAPAPSTRSRSEFEKTLQFLSLCCECCVYASSGWQAARSESFWYEAGGRARLTSAGSVVGRSASSTSSGWGACTCLRLRHAWTLAPNS